MEIHFSSSRDHMATWRKPYKTAFRGVSQEPAKGLGTEAY